MPRTPITPEAKRKTCAFHASQAADAAKRIATELSAGRTPALADAKILEAAGCYIRRNG